jgi:hypothetical protein
VFRGRAVQADEILSVILFPLFINALQKPLPAVDSIGNAFQIFKRSPRQKSNEEIKTACAGNQNRTALS